MSVVAPALVELCAGMAGLSMRLAGRNRLVSYRGGKWGLARDIIRLGCLERPSRYVWAEAHPHARRFLKTFSNPTVSTGAVEVMRGWVDEGPDTMLARWWALKKVFEGKQSYSVDASDEEHCAGFFLWRQVEGARCMPSVNLIGLRLADGAVKNYDLRRPDWIVGKLRSAAKNFCKLCADIYEDAALVEPFRDAVVYLDPPYKGTHGYSEHDLSRDKVVEIALRWHEAGAQVLVSEAVPVEELVSEGWHACQIADRSAFFPGARAFEHVTMNRAPYGAETILEGW